MNSTSLCQEMSVAFGQPRNDYRGSKLGNQQEEEKTILRQGFQSALFIESTLNYPWSDYLYQRCRNKSAPAGLISLGAARCKRSYTSRDGVGPEIMQQLFFSIRLKYFILSKARHLGCLCMPFPKAKAPGKMAKTPNGATALQRYPCAPGPKKFY